jgi:hypothetical protein
MSTGGDSFAVWIVFRGACQTLCFFSASIDIGAAHATGIRRHEYREFLPPPPVRFSSELCSKELDNWNLVLVVCCTVTGGSGVLALVLFRHLRGKVD